MNGFLCKCVTINNKQGPYVPTVIGIIQHIPRFILVGDLPIVGLHNGWYDFIETQGSVLSGSSVYGAMATHHEPGNMIHFCWLSPHNKDTHG